MMRRLYQLLGQHKILIVVFTSIAMSGSLVMGLSESERQVNFISVNGELSSSEKSQVERLLASRQSLSNIDDIKKDIEAVGWIHTANITLHWPDEIAVWVVPEVAIAYWNDDAFINNEGIVFESDYYVGGELPQLYGPVGKEKVVMGHYQKLSRALVKSGHFVDVLVLNERGSIEFGSKNGVRVALGNVDIEQRLQRFLRVSREIDSMVNVPQIKKFDARYMNGVAVDFVEEGEGFEVAKTNEVQGEVNL